jgi:hypothetical protein
VQVDPIKLTLKAPGTKILKLGCDVLISSFAFKFNLRCFIKEDWLWSVGAHPFSATVRRSRLTVSNPVLKAPTVSALETEIS